MQTMPLWLERQVEPGFELEQPSPAVSAAASAQSPLTVRRSNPSHSLFSERRIAQRIPTSEPSAIRKNRQHWQQFAQERCPMAR